jgi:hypothetical protein
MRQIKRQTFIAGAACAAAALAACGGKSGVPSSGAVDDDNFGASLDDAEFAAFDAAPHHVGMAVLATVAPALYGRALTAPPNAVTLSNLPAVTTQGTAAHPGAPGSCEAQSFGTGLGTYTAARKVDGTKKWDAQPLSNQVSAAFLFSKAIQEGSATCGRGSALAHVDTLVAYGAPDASTVAYKPDCSYLETIDVRPSVYTDAARLRIGSYRTYKISGNPSKLQAQIDEFTALIAAGHVIAFSGLVALKYGTNTAQYTNSSGVFSPVPPAYSSTSRWQAPFNDFCDYATKKCGHGQIIVGYDNTKQAFLVQNSFGTSWPPNVGGGQIWWAYSSFFGSQALAAIAYSLPDGKPAGTLFTVGPLSGQPPNNFPIGTINAMARGTTPVNGEYHLTAVLEFGDPVKVGQAGVEPPGASSFITQNENATMSRGYIDFASSTPWPAGTYNVQLAITWNGDTAQYSASVTVT